jgi:hypothetical protein
VETVYEVRLDGKRHPNACSTLSVIGPLQDWERAVSWALRMDWQDPDKKRHQLYFMRKDPLRFLEKSERSFSANYAQEIAYVKWLLGEPNDRFGRNRNWMFTFGPIQVLFDKSCLWRTQKNLRTFLHQHVLLTQASRLLQHLFTTDRTPKKHTV